MTTLDADRPASPGAAVTALLGLAILATAGCSASTPSAASHVSTPGDSVSAVATATTPIYSTHDGSADKYRQRATSASVHLPGRLDPERGGPGTAAQCWPAPTSKLYATVEIGVDMPEPRCLDLLPHQRIAVLNATDRFGTPGTTLTENVGAYRPVSIAPEETVYFTNPVGDYFAIGSHIVGSSASFGGFEVLVRDPRAPAQARRALTAYLHAVLAKDCAAAEHLVASSAHDNGDLCWGPSPMVIDAWRTVEAPRELAAEGVEFALEMHVVSKLDTGAPTPSWIDWFLGFDRTSKGWQLIEGGTGP